jgi:addiction module RelE/StbE family toxin
MKIKNIVFDDSFEKKFTNYKNKATEKQFSKTKELINLFREEPFHPRISTHKLKGKQKEYWSFSISYSDRIVFRFINENDVLFADIGKHDEVYE